VFKVPVIVQDDGTVIVTSSIDVSSAHADAELSKNPAVSIIADDTPINRLSSFMLLS
jgi:hypothetical protein